MPIKVVVVGAGVTGLTTALLLARDALYEVTVVSKHMPGDYDIEYASPWAGANFLPYGAPDSKAAVWERNTFPILYKLATTEPAAGIHTQNTVIWVRKKDAETATGQWMAASMTSEPWYKDLVPDFRALKPDELPEGVDGGTSFTSVCMNTGLYLPYLASQCLAYGAKIKRGSLQHILDAKGLHHSGSPADIIVNCTALGAITLGGVEDKTVYPARGQIVIVRNEADAMYDVSGTDDGGDEIMYIMTRAAGGGTVIGGCYQKNNWSPEPDPDLTERILARAVKACPALTSGKGVEALDIVRTAVGLRPLREDGTRLEAELIKDGERESWVVHSYGHGGFGYQTSYGCAQEAVELVAKAYDGTAVQRHV